MDKDNIGEVGSPRGLFSSALQKMLDALSESEQIYTVIYDQFFTKKTEILADDSVLDFLNSHFTENRIEDLFNRFKHDDIEDVITLPMLEGYLMFRGIALRNDARELLGVLIIMAVNEDMVPDDVFLPPELLHTTEEKLEKATLLLCNLSSIYVEERLYSASLEENLDEASVTGRKLQELLSRNEVMTEILKIMESEDDFQKISLDVLRLSGQYVNFDNGCVFKLDQDDVTVSCVAEWSSEKGKSLGHKISGMKKEDIPFFTGRPFTISSETMIPDNFMNFFMRNKISAGIFLPIMMNDRNTMYLSVTMLGESRKWSIEDLKFLNDVKRVLQTILVKRVIKNSLAGSYYTLESILENVGCSVVVIDRKHEAILYSNENYQTMLTDPLDRRDMEQLIMTFDGDEGIINSNHRVEFEAKSEKKFYELSFEKVKWVDEREVSLITIYDITNIKQYQRRIEHQANTDHLTDLYNRKRFERDLSAEVKNAVRLSTQGAVFFIDLDDFKNINDGLGHSTGDELLVEVALELNRVSGPGVNAYRVGGDEFALIIPSSQHRHLDSISHKIMNTFSKPWKLGNNEYYCTMSMGVVFFPKDGSDADSLMQHADYALKEAKKSGKNNLVYYSENSDGQPIRRLDMERALREAVEDDCKEFEVYYQPIVDGTDKEHPCMGAEALVRWNNKKLGFIMPSDFVPLAEYLGLIVPIGKHVMLEACKRCAYWNSFGHPEYRVNVNLSMVQLMRDNIIDTVEMAIDASGINPDNLVLEVTESLAAQDIEYMKRLLHNMKKMGVHVALDDFGTGYSSLSYIRDMPLDVIKIDKSFVSDVGEDKFSDAFVKTVSDMADSLNVNVVVEGVEKERQQKVLSEMHVDMIQGYYYDKPLPEEEFERKYLI